MQKFGLSVRFGFGLVVCKTFPQHHIVQHSQLIHRGFYASKWCIAKTKFVRDRIPNHLKKKQFKNLKIDQNNHFNCKSLFQVWHDASSGFPRLLEGKIIANAFMYSMLVHASHSSEVAHARLRWTNAVETLYERWRCGCKCHSKICICTNSPYSAFSSCSVQLVAFCSCGVG